jgi:hypothetical protein
MKKRINGLFGYAVCLFTIALLAVGCAGRQAAEVNAGGAAETQIINELPTGDVWLHHLKYDLLPFWTTPEALGNPVGNFPTYRDNDGKLIKGSASDSDTDTEYVRMQSRTYDDREGNTQRVNDIKLDRKIEAQILRYVDGLLVKA